MKTQGFGDQLIEPRRPGAGAVLGPAIARNGEQMQMAQRVVLAAGAGKSIPVHLARKRQVA